MGGFLHAPYPAIPFRLNISSKSQKETTQTLSGSFLAISYYHSLDDTPASRLSNAEDGASVVLRTTCLRADRAGRRDLEATGFKGLVCTAL